MSVLPVDAFSEIIGQTVTNSTDSELPIFKEYLWDFKVNDFVIKDGEFVIVEKDVALKIWIYKVFRTERYKYLAYDNNFGNEFDSLIGKSYSNDYAMTQLQQLIEDCLLINPYIKSVTIIDATLNDNVLTGSASVVTVYGEMEVDLGV